MAPRILTLTTDFGSRDAYVGTMKGVALALAPDLHLVDLVHEVAPQDVLGAAFHLRGAWRYFPAGTVHLAVVDPGVGTPRRSLVASAEGQTFVAPDNGLLPAVFAGSAAAPTYRVLDAARWLPAGASRTFHGRDLYAPVAARLAAGLVLAEEAAPTTVPPSDVVAASVPATVHHADRAEGHVVHVDHFGNLISGLEATDPRVAAHLQAGARVRCGGAEVPVVGTYGDASLGTLVALVNSFGLLEVAAVGGSAAARLGVTTGAPFGLVRAAGPTP